MLSLLDLLENDDSPDWNQIQQLIQSDKKLITKAIDDEGRYLLHYACWKEAPSEFVVPSINDYPKACKVKDNDGCYALHDACRFNQSESVIQLLLKQYPKACEEKDNYGWYALHYACDYNQSVSVIQLLIAEYPKACEDKTKKGCYALHLACRINASLLVIQLLFQHFPNALTIADDNDKTPLDWAKEPIVNQFPNKETISWLHNITVEASKRSKIYFWLINYSTYVQTN